MTSLRRYRLLPALLAASLVLATALPLVQHACAMMEAVVDEAVAEHAPPALPCHDVPSDNAPWSDTSDAPSVLSMPCCTLAAVGTTTWHAPKLDVPVALFLKDTHADVSSLDAETMRFRASGTSPPGQRTPLHIALSRFLT